MKEYSDIFVVADHSEGSVSEVTFEMLEDARVLADSFHEDVIAVVMGTEMGEELFRDLARHGADHVYYVHHPSLRNYGTPAFVRALDHMCRSFCPSNLIIPATPNGQDLAPALASHLGAGLVSFCLSLQAGADGVIYGIREAYEGKVYVTMKCLGRRPHIFTFKPGSAGVGNGDDKREATISDFPIELQETEDEPKLIEVIPADPRSVDLAEADMIVAGGRGVGSKRGMVQLEALADTLGASVGGSRAASDLNWVPQGKFIGLTGKTVSPQLYVAAGISGASYHTTGIKNSKYIIAINTDRGAEIFKMAHLGVVGDLNAIVPLLTAKLKRHYVGSEQ